MKAKLLPEEPTPAMLDALSQGFSDYFGIDASESEFRRIYARVYESVFVSLLRPDDMDALQRFYECVTDFDSGGHDVSKVAMDRLIQIGCVTERGVGRNRKHYITMFGLSCIGGYDADEIPIVPYSEYIESLKQKSQANNIASQQQGKS